MVVIKLSLKDGGRKGPLQSLIRLETAMKADLGSLLEEMGADLAARADMSFKLGGYPVRWKPSLRVKKQGGRTLVVTERLEKSFRIGNVENIFRILGPRLVFGSATPYSKYHMSPRTRHKIPFRPAIRMDPTLKRTLSDTMREWERRKMQEAGFSGR